jgi:hypothetical protein
MAKRKKKSPIKEMSKGIVGIAAGGMIAGAGTTALGTMGAPAAASTGLTTAAGFMPVMGSLIGAKAVIGMTTKLKMPKMKKKRRKR